MKNLKLLATGALAIVVGLSLAQQAGPVGGQFGPPQGGPGGPGRGPGGMRGGPAGPRLLMHPDVQKELKLTEDQKQQLGEIMPKGGPGGPGRGPGGQGGGGGRRGGGGFGGPGGPPQGGGQGGPGGPPQGGGPGGFERGPGGPGGPGHGGELENKIREILTDTQYKRYREIDLQIQGAPALLRPEVGQKVGLSEEQREQIHQILENNRPQMRPPQGGEGQRQDPEKMHAEMEKNREELNKKILAVLTSDQRSTWTSLIGKPFKLTQMRFGPGGPGGQGGPRGPGGGGGGGF